MGNEPSQLSQQKSKQAKSKSVKSKFDEYKLQVDSDGCPENVTAFVPSSSQQRYRVAERHGKQETILKSGSKQKKDDRRQKYKYGSMQHQLSFKNMNVSKYVVQLTMVMDGEEYVGTATIINNKNGTLYLLTCAHNVLNNNSKPATKIWFKLNGKAISATKFYVWPKYKTDPELGHDLAIIESNTRINYQFNEFPEITDFARLAICQIYGFPGEKNGQLYWHEGRRDEGLGWGKHKDQFIAYDIDTTGGQSGSPICNVSGIIGVHTNGDYLGVNRNYGVYFTEEKMKWINKITGAKYLYCEWYDGQPN